MGGTETQQSMHLADFLFEWNMMGMRDDSGHHRGKRTLETGEMYARIGADCADRRHISGA